MWKILLGLLLMLALIMPTALATITIEDMTVTCSPVNNNVSLSQCYKDSAYYFRFVLTDTNAVDTIVDGNLQDWQVVIYYGTSGDALGSLLTVNDANLLTACDTNNSQTDNNFARARVCNLLVPSITNIGNGSYVFDVNVMEGSGGFAAGSVPSDLNVTVPFSINNAAASASTIALSLALVLIVFVAGIMYVLKTDNVTLESVITVILAGIIMGALIVILIG